ncbi:MAG: LuxR C-terminal-related transcriptional regulator [Coriobacteriia bacterium]|nr:LuxR C-terminal-related transcriptional regulator [Coriobacteriia bacterium]
MASKSFDDSGLRVRYMPRSRLDAIFDKATRCNLIYVIAGAGYGKTQTLYHYLKQRRQDAAVRWIQLTDSDNIGSRYWENLAYSISRDNPEFATKLRELGFPETLAQFEQFVEIVRTTEHCSLEAFLVLDDFHLIHSKEVLTFIERCARLDIPGVHMVILSRKEPEINIMSLISKDKVSVVSEDELRFTPTETADFFQSHGIVLSAQDFSHMITTTKGWALAINMLFLSLKRMPSNLEFALEAMTQNIFKLFETEAWKDLPEDAQKAMVKLSLLSDLPIMPVQEIVGDINLLQNTAGISSYLWFDSFANDFKIHPLYLDFLQSKNDILSREEQSEIYQRTAKWCLEHNFYVNAMPYYAKARQFESMLQTLFSYPFKLPHDVSEHFLNVIEKLDPTGKEQSDSSVLFLQDYFVPLLLVGAGRYKEAKQRAFAVIEKWEHADTELSAVMLHAVYSALAFIDMYTCTMTHVYDAPKYMQKSVEYFNQEPFQPAEVTGAFINADMRSFACLVGKGASLSEFDQFLEATKQVALFIEETPLSVYAGYEDLVSCEYAFFKNELDLAKTHAHNAILKASEKRQHSIVALAEKYLLSIAMQEGNVLLVKRILKQLHSHLGNPDFWNRQFYYDLYVGAFYSRIGIPEMAPRWFALDEKEAIPEVSIPAREAFASALYYVSSKKYQQALTVLGKSYPREPHECFLFGEIRLALLSAVARIRTGDTMGAVEDFEKAYQMSFQGTFKMFFIELGKELHPLVSAMLQQESCSISAEWLKATNRKATIYAKKVAIVAQALKSERRIKESAPLSDREQKVLLDLYHGLSREEIAVNQSLSINTVKKVLQSIYIKLGARGNVDAVRIALERKLIE